MKQLIKNYSFNAAAGTVTLSDFTSIRLDRALLITNVTAGVIIYQFNNPGLGGSVSTNVLSLTYNTAAMSNSDALQIIYDSAAGDPTYDTQPISDSLTVNAGTNLNTSALALETGGNLAAAKTDLDTIAGAVSGNRVQAQIVDSAGTNKLAINASGQMSIANFPASQPVSGTVTANIGTSGSLALDATLTGGSQQTKMTDGTNIANILKSDGTAAGQNAQFISGAYKEATGLSAGSLNADLVPSTDVSAYKWLSLQVTGTYSGTLTFQISNDGTNFTSFPLCLSTSYNTNNMATSTTGTGQIFVGPVIARYLRVRMTAYTSGTATGTLETYTIPPTPVTMANAGAFQSGTWNVGSSSATGSAAPSNAFLVGAKDSSGNLQPLSTSNNIGDAGGSTSLATTAAIYNGSTYDRARSATAAAATTGTGLLGTGVLGIFNTSAPTVTSGNYERLQLDSNANLKVVAGGTVAAGSSDSGNPVKVGGKYNTTLPTLTDGQRGDAQLDAKSVLMTNLAYQLSATIDSITAYPFGHSYTNVTATGATTIKTGTGTIHQINFNNPSAFTSGAIMVLYDNTAASGTIIDTFTLPISATAMPFSLSLNKAFGTGLTINITASAGTPNVGVSWR